MITEIIESFKNEISFVEGMAYGGKSLESLKHEDRVRTCPDCESKDIGFDKGESFCKKCGLVLD